jgi:hypothetical protein
MFFPPVLLSPPRRVADDEILPHTGGNESRVKKRDAQAVIVDAINAVAEAYASPQHAIRASEGILRFLGRANTYCKLASLIPQDVW